MIPPEGTAGPVIPPEGTAGGGAGELRSPITLVSMYRANVGVGAMLHAVDRLNYTTFVKASRWSDRAAIQATLKKHQVDVARLKFIGSLQRMLLARTPLIAGITPERVGAGKARLTVGKRVVDVNFPSREAKAALEQMTRDMTLGEINLPFIIAEAENPQWAYLHALGLHRLPDTAFTYTGDVLNVINDVVAAPVYMLKHLLLVKRPYEMDPRIKPWIPVPRHSSFPSGHSTYAHATAVVLNALVGPSDKTLLPKLASAIAKRREFAGLHTQLDSAMGETLGTAIGEYMVKQATSGTSAGLGPWRALFALAGSEWAVKKL